MLSPLNLIVVIASVTTRGRGLVLQGDGGKVPCHCPRETRGAYYKALITTPRGDLLYGPISCEGSGFSYHVGQCTKVGRCVDATNDTPFQPKSVFMSPPMPTYLNVDATTSPPPCVLSFPLCTASGSMRVHQLGPPNHYGAWRGGYQLKEDQGGTTSPMHEKTYINLARKQGHPYGKNQGLGFRV